MLPLINLFLENVKYSNTIRENDLHSCAISTLHLRFNFDHYKMAGYLLFTHRRQDSTASQFPQLCTAALSSLHLLPAYQPPNEEALGC